MTRAKHGQLWRGRHLKVKTEKGDLWVEVSTPGMKMGMDFTVAAPRTPCQHFTRTEGFHKKNYPCIWASLSSFTTCENVAKNFLEPLFSSFVQQEWWLAGRTRLTEATEQHTNALELVTEATQWGNYLRDQGLKDKMPVAYRRIERAIKREKIAKERLDSAKTHFESIER